jgi:UDP:flavonoid glycosyltransferase YjiC (YdhE family)
MNITILTLGSRGDIEPFLALAVGLQKSAHNVTLVAPPAYSEWIRSYGVEISPLGFDVGRFYAKHKLEIRAGKGSRWRRLRSTSKAFAAGIASTFDDYQAASADADFILQTGAAHGGVEIAQLRNIPLAFGHIFPTAPTREFPAFLIGWRGSLGKTYNRLTHAFMRRVLWGIYGKPLNRWRTERLGMPAWRSLAEMLDARRDAGAPSLFAYSPSVLPEPVDWQATDHVTGYWFLPAPENWVPSPGLLDFLGRGPAPVFVGFGSMPGLDPARRTRDVLRALEISGQRGVLMSAGAGALARVGAPSNAIFVDDIPYSWLFPRMAAVVHHGGAGTTAAALRAGVPSIIMPVDFDQFGWAQRVEDLGVGLRGDKLEKLTAENLAKLISVAVGDESMRARATALGERIRSEDGISKAVEIIESHAEHFNGRMRSGSSA